MTSDRQKAARELLTFYLEAGVDTPLGETPVDRFADEAPKIAPSPPPATAEPQIIERPPTQIRAPLATRTIGPSELGARAEREPASGLSGGRGDGRARAGEVRRHA